MREQRQYESVRELFTEQQMAAMKDDLVQAVGEVKMLRTEKTASMSTMGAAIKAAEKLVFELQEKLSLGYEVIDVEVIAVYDEPEPGTKKIVRADTGKELRVEPMTARERQQSFGFGIAGEDSRPEK
jgi:hypothetical protein